MRLINMTLALIIAILVVTIFSTASARQQAQSSSPIGSEPDGTVGSGTADQGHGHDGQGQTGIPRHTVAPDFGIATATDVATDVATDTGSTKAESAATLASAGTVDAATDAATATSTTSALGHRALPSPEAIEADRKGAEALAQISYPWQERLPGWEIAFYPAEGGAYGYTLTREHRIDIYVRPDQSAGLLAHVVAHEIGHAVDVTLNSGDDRRRWQELRGIEAEPWWPDNRAPDFSTGAGDFAESFAAWQVGPDAFRSNLGTPPSTEAKALLAELSLA